MTAYGWAACVLGACFCLWRAYAAGRRAERLRRLKEEVRAYEQMEALRRRVDNLSVDGIINILRAGRHKN